MPLPDAFDSRDLRVDSPSGSVRPVDCSARTANAGALCFCFDAHQIHVREVAHVSVEVLFPALAARGPGSTRGLQPGLSMPLIGTNGALIFEDFRARLHLQRPAMAASGALRSTQ